MLPPEQDPVYRPEFNRLREEATALNFVRANPFAILVSTGGEGSPFATHLPILVRDVGGRSVLWGHVARANPHWQHLQDGQEALAIFHGAHAYISPTLCDAREVVPTWNYAAVHAYGQARTFSDEAQLEEVLRAMIGRFESSYLTQWSALDPAYRRRMLSPIVGFEMKLNRVEGKFKLSQNRSPAEQARIAETLSRSEDSPVAEIARLMRERRW
jgi:transcriptional regulator